MARSKQKQGETSRKKKTKRNEEGKKKKNFANEKSESLSLESCSLKKTLRTRKVNLCLFFVGYWFLDQQSTWTPPADLVKFMSEVRKKESV